jgi:ABC-type lipoprotein release transport system permease subunit
VTLAFTLTRSLGALLYGVAPNDPLTFVLAPVMLVVVAIAASVEPMWRARRIDPVTALRAE